MIYRKINSLAVYIFFYNLTSYFQLFTITTWLISAPNINLSTFRIVLDGTIWTPLAFLLQNFIKNLLTYERDITKSPRKIVSANVHQI